MGMQSAWEDPFAAYAGHFYSLMGDQRTRRTFAETLRGIIAAGSLVCQRIAAVSPVLAAVENGAQRVIRLVKGQSTDRSTLRVGQLTERLRARGVAQLGEADTGDLWLILDLSELRKPQAQEMPALTEVQAALQPVRFGIGPFNTEAQIQTAMAAVREIATLKHRSQARPG